MTETPETGIDSMKAPTARHVVSTWNIANIVTVARLALVPLFTVCLFVDGNGWRLTALAVFVVASLTDRLDGELARRYGLVTDFGKIADPIADKTLIGAALVSLSLLDELPWWVTIAILGREIGVTLLRFAVIRLGVIPASWGGKVKTVVQVVAIVLYILPGVPGPIRWIVMGAALAVTVLTGADYVVRALRLRRVARQVRAETAAKEARSEMSPSAQTPADPLAEGAGEVLALLVGDGATVAVAESLTGGSLGAALTTPAGSSVAFRGGVIAYATEVKHSLLDVPEELLKREGAVHPDVAAAMAAGARLVTGSTYGIGVTGVAGPDEQDGKPVGTVHIAVSGPGERFWHRDPLLRGSREEIRAATVREAIELLRGVLTGTLGEHSG